MRSPCHRCTPLSCVMSSRKHDCLAPYPMLRSIGNSTAGFKETNESVLRDFGSIAENAYYDRMTRRTIRKANVDDLL